MYFCAECMVCVLSGLNLFCFVFVSVIENQNQNRKRSKKSVV